MKRRSLAAATALLALLTMAAGCTADAKPAPPNTPGSTTSGQTTSGQTMPGQTTPISTAPDVKGSRVVWRGAVLTLDPGWRKVFGDKEVLCLQTEPSQDGCGSDRPTDLIYLYASERSGADGEPGHASSLDASGMDSYTYDGGDVPCDFPYEPPMRKGTRPVGGRTAYYGEWRLACTGGPVLLVQRWVLPKSRLGVLTYATSEPSAERIEQMIAAMDLSHFTPTTPGPGPHY